jgi:hypothetical protein
MKRSIVQIIIVAAIAALTLAGCGDDGIGTQTDERVGRFLNRFIEKHPLILGPGQAWVELDNGNYGFIFYEDGHCDFVEKKANGQWTVYRNGTWTESGEINCIFDYRYRFVGGVLLLEKSSSSGDIETIRFTKQNGVNVM